MLSLRARGKVSQPYQITFKIIVQIILSAVDMALSTSESINLGPRGYVSRKETPCGATMTVFSNIAPCSLAENY
jgi:hypothetical protein